MAEGIERAQPDDPNRCQSITKFGQCPNLAMEGVKHCKIHGGAYQQTQNEVKNMNRYRVAKWQERIKHFGTDNNIKNIRDEVAILRMLMEERLNQCATPVDMILQSGPISDLVMKIERVVTTCHNLEKSMGFLLDKQQILQFADRVIAIISESITDQALVEQIATRIAAALEENKDDVC